MTKDNNQNKDLAEDYNDKKIKASEDVKDNRDDISIEETGNNEDVTIMPPHVILSYIYKL